MGTRAKIRIEANGKYLCSKYLGMDGYVENWAAMLITALNQTTPRAILRNRQLLKLMFEDYESDDYLDYLCEIDISDCRCISTFISKINIPEFYRFGMTR